MGRILSSLGIGAATVETVLPKTEFHPGETVTATVEIEGGSTEQTIDALHFAVLTQVGGSDHVVDRFQVREPLTIAAGESRRVTTDVTIPPWTPLTRDGRRVWLKTGLDVSWAVDPNDEDDVEVVPGPFTASLLTAAEALGFEYQGSEVREPEWLDRPLVQAFRYEPGPEVYRDDVEELTLVTIPRADSLRAVIEIDELEEAEAETEVEFDRQEVLHTFTVASEDMVRRELRAEIDRHTNT